MCSLYRRQIQPDFECYEACREQLIEHLKIGKILGDFQQSHNASDYSM